MLERCERRDKQYKSQKTYKKWDADCAVGVLAVDTDAGIICVLAVDTDAGIICVLAVDADDGADVEHNVGAVLKGSCGVVA